MNNRSYFNIILPGKQIHKGWQVLIPFFSRIFVVLIFLGLFNGLKEIQAQTLPVINIAVNLDKLTSNLKKTFGSKDSIEKYHVALEKMLKDMGKDTGDLRWRADIMVYSEGVQVVGSSGPDRHAVLRVPLRVFMSIDPNVGKNQSWTEVWIDINFNSKNGVLNADYDVVEAWTRTAFAGGWLPGNAGDRTRTIRGAIEKNLVPFIKATIEDQGKDFLPIVRKGQPGVCLNFEAGGRIVATAIPQSQDGPALKPQGMLTINAGWGEGGKPSTGFVSQNGRLDDLIVCPGKCLDALEFHGVRLGGKGGNPHPVGFRSDEDLIGVEPRIGGAFDAITFDTTKRSYGPFGGPGGDQHRAVFVPAGYRIIGFRGWSDKLIDGLVLIAMPIN